MQKPGKLSIADYSYDLPHDRIARYPLKNRDESKLLVSSPEGAIREDRFYNLPGYLEDNSMLVYNNTKVVQARLKFHKTTGAEIEIFCLEPIEPVTVVDQAFEQPSPVVWKCFVKNARKWKDQILRLDMGQDILYAEKIKMDGDAWWVKFSWDKKCSWAEILEEAGRVPLPPYIKREDEPDDKLRYQTVFAERDGSVAAPTAGLHFTDKIFSALDAKNIQRISLTLHVGAGTFKPVSSEKIEHHEMHQEQVLVSRNELQKLLNTSKDKTIAVGTTSVRTLESLYWYANALAQDPDSGFVINQWQPYNDKAILSREEALQILIHKLKKEDREYLQGATSLMIVPGYEYKMIGGMITNFHQPKSTLLLLVAAFIGDNWKKAYQFALDKDFRFLSYGDSCLFFPAKKK
ncbi:MAG: S-adenosylmethionine:tRNA ribosyltransferase-isomerase [Bacteroidales bacterium]|nr:S-adenosylmethionine:tRNA ribosyltransferase-isomerase [Bacteroidales bacterium]MCF8327664.1 S-adenosylmethionine:tRNA ribosyltransferase-isomerase [Bacteroidales bacterium]